MMAPPPSGMMAPPTSMLPPLVARPLPARISDLESRVKRLKDVQALREKFLKVLTKEQTKKLKPYLDKDLI